VAIYISSTRRDAIKTIVGAAVSLGVLSRPLRASLILVPLGEDRFIQLDDKASVTRSIEGIDFTLDQSLMPGNMNVMVRGDRVTLSGVLSMPGMNVTIVARELTCVSGAAISTVGKVGDHNYKGVTAPPGADGASADAGKRGGQIIIYAGKLIGELTLDASGGAGGDAMNGGIGLQGNPGQNATRDHGGGAGNPGRPGGLAGTPGAGGSGGDITVGAIAGTPLANIQCKSSGGTAGNPATNGTPGAGGSGGSPRSGTDVHSSPCIR
jgi:hypothetical protein